MSLAAELSRCPPFNLHPVASTGLSNTGRRTQGDLDPEGRAVDVAGGKLRVAGAVSNCPRGACAGHVSLVSADTSATLSSGLHRATYVAVAPAKEPSVPSTARQASSSTLLVASTPLG